jgi:WD40 repeat protein
MLFRMQPPTHRWTVEGSTEVMVSVSNGKGARAGKAPPGLDEYIRCLAWSPDGKWIAVGGDDRTLRVLDADSGRVSPFVLADCHERSIHCVAWSPAGDRIVSSSGSALIIWDVFNGACLRRRASGGDILAAAWAPGGDHFATVAEDGELVLWTRLEPTPLGHSPDEIAVLSWSPDGKFLVGAYARVWDTAFGRLVAEIPVGEGVRTIAWDRAGARLALASDTGTVQIVSTETWQQAGEIVSLPSTHRSLCLAFSTTPFSDSHAVCAELHLSSVPLA